jgi:hypothetical protein
MSPIDQRYEQMGGAAGFLGAPVSDEQTTGGGRARFRIYEHGAIYWIMVDLQAGFGLSTQTYEVHGAIWQHWKTLGTDGGLLGLPLSDETACPDGRGRFNHFQNGSIYWHPDTNAHEIHGWIRDHWSSLGWERGALGYPTTDETGCPDGTGRFNHFQNGSIYYHPQTGVYEVHGAIHAKWSEIGWERGALGYPTTDETGCPDGTGRFNHFQNGSIYWRPEIGARETHGAIGARWAALGWERSYLGYPTSDEEIWIDQATNTGGRRNRFQRGRIEWTGGGTAVDLPDTLNFGGTVTTPPGTQLGGSVGLELRSDGSYTFQGHMHDSGPDPYEFRVRAFLRTPSGVAVSAQHSGHVDGTGSSIFGKLHRDNDWNESLDSPEIRFFWEELKTGATFSIDKEYKDVGLLGNLADLLTDAAIYVLGASVVGAPLAFDIVAGKELLEATGGSVGVGGMPGVIVAGGIAWAVGPGALIPALAAGAAVGAITDELIKYRPLDPSERQFAEGKVFSGTLPDRIFITNLIHYSGNPNAYFTDPNVDGAVLVHMGDAYDDPMGTTKPQYGYKTPGQVFIHELTHAWQIKHMGVPNYFCEVLGGTQTYDPGPAGGDWNSFGLEQQATMVDRWFAGALDSQTQMDDKSAYFRYIRDNIRVGQA